MFRIRNQPCLVVVSQEDFLDLSPDFAMQPAIGPELPEHDLEVMDASADRPSRTFKSAAEIATWTCRNGSVRSLGEGLKAWQSSSRLVLFGKCLRNLLLHSRVAGKEGLEPAPDLHGLVVLLSPLINAAECLKDVEQVGAGGLSCQGTFKSQGRVFGLADQNECLSEIKGGQGIAGAVCLGVLECGDGGGVLPALKFEESEDEPCLAVVWLRLEPVAIRLDERIERPALDVVAIHTIERRPPPRISLEQRKKPLLSIAARWLRQQRRGRSQPRPPPASQSPPAESQ